MSIIVSHPTGNSNVRAVLRGLQDRGLLQKFCTTLAFPQSLITRAGLPSSLKEQFASRVFQEIPGTSIDKHPTRETVRQIAKRIGLKNLTRHEEGWASYHRVYYDLDRAVASKMARYAASGAKAIYAYEDGAKTSFQAARRVGAKCMYDLPSPHWRAVHELLDEEKCRNPNWACTIDALLDSDRNRSRKDEEIELADQIFVASSYARSALSKSFDVEDRISVVPYGAPFPRAKMPSERLAGEPIRVFFAGRLSQSKGIADLISALHRLDTVWHATLAGSLPRVVPEELSDFLARDNVDYLGFISRDRLLDVMQQSHVFVFPSLYEGFGMVITEAMACGLPVIATPNTAAPDLILEAREGFVVPIRDPDSIAEKITMLAEDETFRQQMAQSALDLAARTPWSRYEDGLVSKITSLVAV